MVVNVAGGEADHVVIVVLSEDRRMSDNQSLVQREYKVLGRNKVSMKKVWKESDFEDGETGFNSCIINEVQ